MDNDTERLKKRMAELSQRSFFRQMWIFSEFLNINEQSVLKSMGRDEISSGYYLYGGYDAAERVVACFGSEELCGYVQCPPIVCVKVQPLSQKFADNFTHRDFLGALMSLGIRREVLGDIIISDNCGYIVCLDSIAGYIAGSLEQVRRTSVKCSVEQSVPETAAPVPVPVRLVIASERIDAIVSAVYKLSRSESQRLFEQEKIFINGKMAPRLSVVPENGDVVSVRGYGRFIYDGIEKQTRKGRICVNVKIYQ